jgi:hypothetical protein
MLQSIGLDSNRQDTTKGRIVVGWLWGPRPKQVQADAVWVDPILTKQARQPLGTGPLLTASKGTN